MIGSHDLLLLCCLIVEEMRGRPISDTMRQLELTIGFHVLEHPTAQCITKHRAGWQIGPNGFHELVRFVEAHVRHEILLALLVARERRRLGGSAAFIDGIMEQLRTNRGKKIRTKHEKELPRMHFNCTSNERSPHLQLSAAVLLMDHLGHRVIYQSFC